jgi:hypothetical protein
MAPARLTALSRSVGCDGGGGIETPMLDINNEVTLERSPSRPSAGRFCVLITSSDRGRDIFEIVFQNAETMWRNCDWPRYVGFTSKYLDLYGFKALTATRPSDWRGEVGDYLDALPDHIEYVLRIDEDALFVSPVDADKLNAIADLMVSEDLSYVSLVPLRRNLLGSIVEYFRRRVDKRPLRRLSFSEPYYSSVGLAIWQRSYLRSLLREPGSIWDLEQRVTNVPHYAVWKPILDQNQIVTKGKWYPWASRLLARQGIRIIDSKREFQPLKSRLRDIREMISFQVAGFLSFRIRRRLKKL